MKSGPISGILSSAEAEGRPSLWDRRYRRPRAADPGASSGLLAPCLALLRAALAELDGKIADATKRRDDASIEIENELKRFAEERAQLVPTIHPEVLALYEDIRARRGGVAVGALVDGTCRACGLPLSPMQRDEIKRSDEPIIRCENCRRLLVIPEG